MQNKQTPFWLFTMALLFALTLPVLVQDGMFQDGMLYAGIAKNLAEDRGSFWALHFSPSLFNIFNGHPPLAFGIQALFFKILGNSIYTERVYSFFTFCITLVLISFLWKRLFAGNKVIQCISWLPCLLWGITPLVFWSYSNNMLENTMGVFTLLACLFILESRNKKRSLFFIIAAGGFIFLGTLCKGLPALFPIAMPVLIGIANRNPSVLKNIFHSILLLATVVVLYALIFTYEPARISIMSYVNNQILPSINDGNATVDSRLFILLRLIAELAVPLTILLLVWFYSKQKKSTLYFDKEILKSAQLFFLIGLSASLPIMITLKQSGYYLVPSFPYFAIGFACLLSPLAIQTMKQISVSYSTYRNATFITVFLLLAVLLFSALQIGKTVRDKDMLHDVHLIGEKVAPYTIVSATYRIATDWSFHEYLTRNFDICLADKIRPEYEFFIEENADSIPNLIKTERVNIPTKKYNLYKIIK